MRKYDGELKHWRGHLRIAEDDLEALTSRQRKMAESQGDGWVDTTEKWTERLRTEVAAIEQLIAAYEQLQMADYSTPSKDDPLAERDVFPE